MRPGWISRIEDLTHSRGERRGIIKFPSLPSTSFSVDARLAFGLTQHAKSIGDRHARLLLLSVRTYRSRENASGRAFRPYRVITDKDPAVIRRLRVVACYVHRRRASIASSLNIQLSILRPRRSHFSAPTSPSRESRAPHPRPRSSANRSPIRGLDRPRNPSSIVIKSISRRGYDRYRHTRATRGRLHSARDYGTYIIVIKRALLLLPSDRCSRPLRPARPSYYRREVVYPYNEIHYHYLSIASALLIRTRDADAR